MEHQPLRSTDVRDRNQKLILRLLFQNGAMSQSLVVQKTGLKAPTVFRIFSRLEEHRFIRPCKGPEPTAGDNERERKGRRPAYYCVVPHAAFAVGVDFSTAGASVIIVNFVNEVIHHHTADFPSDIRRDEVLSRIGAMIGSAIDASEIDPNRIVGIGIGAPGTVNTDTGVVVEYARIDGLAGYGLKDHFREMFHVPVFVHNNTSVIAASEYHYGEAREFASVLAVLVRGGVGGAFVNHGRIFLNGTTTALELGRTSVCVHESDAAARDRTSLETLVGEQALLDYLARGTATEIESWEAAEASFSFHQLSEKLRERADILATSVRNLYHVVHPDAVLVISRYETLAGVLTDAVARAVPEVTSIPITYDAVKACYGATDLVFQQFFLQGSSGTSALAD